MRTREHIEITAPRDKIRLAIVGTGLRGDTMASLIRKRPDAEIVALVDSIPEKAAWLSHRLGLERAIVFRSIEEALATVAFDAAMIFTPDGLHAHPAIAALRAGKRVFCEKPLEITAERCAELIEADEAAGGKTFVGFNLRHAPFYATVKQCLDEGGVGRILTVQADEFYDGGRTYFRRWNGLREKSGGLWITKAAHDFDLLLWLTGARPLEVFANAARSYYVPKPEAGIQCRACSISSRCPDRAPEVATDLQRITEERGGSPYDLCLYNAPSDTFDHGMAQIRFENDIFATYTCNVVAGFTDRRLRISGTKATVEGCFNSQSVTVLRRDPASVEQIPVPTTGDIHGGADPIMVGSFLEFVRLGGQPPCTPREAALPVCVGLAATKSSDEGRPIAIEMQGPPWQAGAFSTPCRSEAS